MHARTAFFVFLLSIAAIAGAPLHGQKPASARLPAAASTEAATLLTQGWAFLAQGEVALAAERGRRALAAAPRDAASLVLMVEVEIARGGAASAREFYSQWVGQRTLEEPIVLRRIAYAALVEWAGQQDPRFRLAALRALAAAGDASALSALAAAGAEGGTAEARAAAELGDARAVGVLLKELESGQRNPVATLQALGQSSSRAAVRPVQARLSDPRPEVRGAAAEALGRLGAESAIEALKRLLDDPSSHVRVNAAAALYRMNDLSGVRIFRELLDAPEPSAAGRLVAAEAMSSRPDGEWLALVRSLTTATEPDVRLGAARLIAPHDPQTARAVLQELTTHSNPAFREEAQRTLAQEALTDLTALRRLLASADPLTQIGAARTIVHLTR